MNENNQRKTLLSIKLSTLLLIVLIIIIFIVVGIVIATKSNNSENNKDETTNRISNEVKEVSQVPVPEMETTTERKELVITSRSSEGRNEEIPVIEQEEPEQVEEVQEPVIQTTPIEEVTISKDMDLTVRTGLSRDDFILLISRVEQDTSNFFEENAGLIYDMCEKYQINEIFLCGLISAESGWSIASNHRNTHNYISLMSNNGLIKFASVEEGIEKAAQTLHDNYLTPGGRFYYGTTLSAVKTKFCPASSTWVNLVFQRMNQILN